MEFDSLNSVHLELLEFCLVFVMSFILKCNVRAQTDVRKGQELWLHIPGLSQGKLAPVISTQVHKQPSKHLKSVPVLQGNQYSDLPTYCLVFWVFINGVRSMYAFVSGFSCLVICESCLSSCVSLWFTLSHCRHGSLFCNYSVTCLFI